MQNLLIMGLDPGTTLAYSLLDLNGNLIKLNSSKQLDSSSLTLEVLEYGEIVIISTDVYPLPSFVLNFANKIGARIISTDKNLKVDEKRDLIKDFKVSNNHERDALASSLFAYKKIKPLLKKIDLFIKKNKKEAISNDLTELVLKKNISLHKALELIEKKEFKIIKQKIILEQPKRELDIKIKRLQEENQILRKELTLLNNKLRYLERSNAELYKKMNREFMDEKIKQILYFKNQKIEHFKKENEGLKKELEFLNKDLTRLKLLLANLTSNKVLKKLNTLSYDEIREKNKILNIQEKDILLVDNPNIYSEKTFQFLKDKVSIIITKTKTNLDKFAIIDSKNLNITETENFALVPIKDLEKEMVHKKLLLNILKEYKEERKSK